MSFDSDSDVCIVEIIVSSDSELLPTKHSTLDNDDTGKSNLKKVRFLSEHQSSPRKKKKVNHKWKNPKKQSEHTNKQVSSSGQQPKEARVPPVATSLDEECVDDFEVEAILGHRTRLDTGKPEFLLKWKGYPSSENSWEPPANLVGCTEMLHFYVLNKVLPVSEAPDLTKPFIDLLPADLRKAALRQARISHEKRRESPKSHKESKKSGTQKTPVPKSSHKKVSGESREEKVKRTHKVTNGHVKDRKRLSSSASKPTKQSLISNKQQSLEKAVGTASKRPKTSPTSLPSVAKKKASPALPTVRKKATPLTIEHASESSKKTTHSTSSSKKSSKTTKTNHRKKSDQVQSATCPLLSPEEEDKDQENMLEDGLQGSQRSHSVESLKECSRHCNGIIHTDKVVKYISPCSPAMSLSPFNTDSSSRLSYGSLASSYNDSLQFRLELSPSPPSDLDSSFDEEPSPYQPGSTPRSHSNLNERVKDPRLSSRSKHESKTSSLPSPIGKPLIDSTETCIPRFLLHKQKLFSTPMPLPRSKRKNCCSNPVPTKAAKSNSSTKNSNGFTSAKSIRNRHSTSPPIRFGRAPGPAATLLYKELLLNWQHQLNRQRDGTDEYIIVENYFDRVPPPSQFKYISSNSYASGVPDPSSPEVSSSLCGCECYSLGKKCGTKSATFCCPKMADAGFAYSKAGKVQIEPGTPIYECNSKCSCPPDCGNKVVQHGRKIPLCIFRTGDGRGWGVKAIQAIKAHSFVTEYVGEVITSEEAERRGKLYDQQGATYLFDLDFDDDNSEFTIDAAHEGNISHFFNHSCQPNLVVYSVWIESLDKRLPRIAFFTTRNVSAGDELTFDYQMNHDQVLPTPTSSRHKKMRMRCLCGSEKCLGYYW